MVATSRIQRRQRQAEQGQSLVEFALSLPIVLSVLIGIVGMSYIFYSWLTIYHAAHEGLSYAIRNPASTSQQVIDQTKPNMLSLYQGDANTTITVDKLPNQVEVTVRYLVPLPEISIPTLLTSTRITVLRPIQLEVSGNSFYD